MFSFNVEKKMKKWLNLLKTKHATSIENLWFKKWENFKVKISPWSLSKLHIIQNILKASKKTKRQGVLEDLNYLLEEEESCVLKPLKTVSTLDFSRLSQRSDICYSLRWEDLSKKLRLDMSSFLIKIKI